MEQQRLGLRLAVEILTVQAEHRAGRGWSLVIRSRRQGQPWDECRTEQYDELTTAELGDVLELALPSHLEL